MEATGLFVTTGAVLQVGCGMPVFDLCAMCRSVSGIVPGIIARGIFFGMYGYCVCVCSVLGRCRFSRRIYIGWLWDTYSVTYVQSTEEWVIELGGLVCAIYK